MHALIPLLFILVFFNSRQLKSDLLYRANVFSLIGINYFVIFYYTVYWYNIFPTKSLLQYLPGLTLSSLLVALALSPWTKKSHVAKTAFFVSALVLTLTWHFLFDTEIKEKLAEAGGYFATNMSANAHQTTAATHKLLSVGIQLKLNDTWRKESIKSGHFYFQKIENDKIVAELRPNCSIRFNLDTPTYISNVLKAFEAKGIVSNTKRSCSLSDENKLCLLQVDYLKTSKVKSRWDWINRNQNKHSIKMSVVFFQFNKQIESEVREILASTKTTLTAPTNYCHTPSAWL